MQRDTHAERTRNVYREAEKNGGKGRGNGDMCIFDDVETFEFYSSLSVALMFVLKIIVFLIGFLNGRKEKQ